MAPADKRQTSLLDPRAGRADPPAVAPRCERCARPNGNHVLRCPVGAWELVNVISVFFSRGNFPAMDDDKVRAYQRVLGSYPYRLAQRGIDRVIRSWGRVDVPPIGVFCQEIEALERAVRGRIASRAEPEWIPPTKEFKEAMARIGRAMPEVRVTRDPENSSTMTEADIEARREQLRRQAEYLGVR